MVIIILSKSYHSQPKNYNVKHDEAPNFKFTFVILGLFCVKNIQKENIQKRSVKTPPWNMKKFQKIWKNIKMYHAPIVTTKKWFYILTICSKWWSRPKLLLLIGIATKCLHHLLWSVLWCLWEYFNFVAILLALWMLKS